MFQSLLSRLIPAGPTGLTVLSVDGRWVKLLHATGRASHRTVTMLLAHAIEGLSEEEVVAWLREACAARGFEAGSVLLANPAYLTTTRLFTVPSTHPAEIREIVELQAEKHTPYAKEEILTDFQIVDTDAAGYSRVLLVISHHDVVHRGLKLLEGMGWTLERVGFELEGLLRWARTAHPDVVGAEGALLVAEIDHDTTSVVILHQGKPALHRSVAVGWAQVQAPSIEEGATKLSGELQRTIEMFDAEGGTVSVNRVLLTGQAARVPELAERIQQQLNVPTTASSAFERVTVAESVNPDDEPVNQVAWASLAGAALGVGEIDLTPPTMKLHRAFEIRSRALVGLGCQAIAMLLLVACVIMGHSYHSERYHAWLVRQQSESAQQAVEVERMAEQLSLVKSWQRDQGQVLEAVLELEARTPSAIRWDTITFVKDTQLILKGASTDMPKVFEFAEAVKLSALFATVEARRVTKRKVEEEDVTEFELVCAFLPPESS